MYLYFSRAPGISRHPNQNSQLVGGSGCLARHVRAKGCFRRSGGRLRTGSGAGSERSFTGWVYTAFRQWWESSRIEWCSKGGSGGWSVQSARRNDRLSARYVPSRYHEPRFTNVVHCYVLEKYRRSTLLTARTRAPTSFGDLRHRCRFTS